MIEGKVVFDNERYRVTDYYLKDVGVTVSITELHKDQETRGNTHDNPETYIFNTPAELIEDGVSRTVSPGEHVVVKGGVHHKIRTTPEHFALFTCVFMGRREEKSR